MKFIIICFLFFGANFGVFSQQSKFSFGVEYSPGFSNLTSRYSFYQFQQHGFWLSQNVFMKTGYAISPKFKIMGGLGYMDTRDFTGSNLYGFENIDRIEVRRFHHYLLVTIGVKYHLGTFYVQPEVGTGINVANTFLQTTTLIDSTNLYTITENKYVDTHNIYQVYRYSYPAFLTIGHEMAWKKWTFSFGIKGYYALNLLGRESSVQGHSFGFGILVGVEF